MKVLRGIWVGVAAAAVGLGATCQVQRPDVTGTGDERIDEQAQVERAAPAAGKAGCAAEPAGNLSLIDARTASPLACVPVTVSVESTDCPEGMSCPAALAYRGDTNALGQVRVKASLEAERVSAVAEGYVPSYRRPGPVTQTSPAEIEMIPSDGFLLKFLDAEGNYLTKLPVVFKQGADVIAQMRTNELANAFFPSRTPFAGEAVTIEAEGFAAATVNGPADLGEDGHTVVLRR